MKHASFQKFIDLVTFDKKYHELQEQLQTAQELIDAAKVQRSKFETTVEASFARRDEAQKNVHASELDIKTLEEQEKEYKGVLDQVKNVKEHKAAQKELEGVQFKRNELEGNLARLWNRFETLKEEAERVDKEAQVEFQKIDEEIQKHEAVVAQVQKDLNSYNDERSQKLDGIKPEWLEKYEMMKGRSTNPVVPLDQESCSACFYMVSSQDLQKLKQDELLHCKDCYRLLYVPEETQEAEAQ